VLAHQQARYLRSQPPNNLHRTTQNGRSHGETSKRRAHFALRSAAGTLTNLIARIDDVPQPWYRCAELCWGGHSQINAIGETECAARFYNAKLRVSLGGNAFGQPHAGFRVHVDFCGMDGNVVLRRRDNTRRSTMRVLGALAMVI